MTLSLLRSSVGGSQTIIYKSHPFPCTIPCTFPIRQSKTLQKTVTTSSGNGGSARVPKDPKAYANIEELRRELEDAKGQAPFTLTRTIKWLSDAANNGGASGGGLAFQAYKWVLGLDTPPTWNASWRRPVELEAQALLKIEESTDPELIEAIQALLMIPKSAAIRLIYRCPAAGQMSSLTLMMRIVDLKGIFPSTNVARMVELVPTAFLAEPAWEETLVNLRRTSELLREGLKGADIDAIFEADPTILFESPESIELGLRRMKELWQVDVIALKNSEPEELALAVRALSLQGPPKSV